MQIRWVASSSASALHAAVVLARGETLVDGAWQSALEEPAAALSAAIEACGTRVDLIWRHLLALSASIDNNRQLVETALRKSCGAALAQNASRVAGCVAEVEAAVARVQPKLAEELLLRARPLSEQWEARGPGLLHKLAAQIEDPQLFVTNADVILVQPVQGGGGEAHLLYNSVRIEAVLANPAADVPEVARLAWLLAQLNHDLPRFSEQLEFRNIHEVAALALIPVTLVAAEHVELSRFDEATLDRTITLWRVPRLTDDLAAILMDWWQTYAEARPTWPVALQALERLLG